MLKMFKYIFWLVAVLILAVVIDQTMINVPLDAPGLKQGQRFYVDFRTRLIGLFDSGQTSPKGDKIMSVIEQKTLADSNNQKTSQRYLYVDGDGALQFVDSYQAVPAKYRDSAQPLAD